LNADPRKSDFYAGLANDYDQMTRLDERLARERNVIREWLNARQLRSVLDVACGTGVHVIALSQLGVRAIGLDNSKLMIDRAKANADHYGISADFVLGDMSRASDFIDTNVDAILCLGNSIPHILSIEKLETTFTSLKECLNPGGVLVIQLLNYDRILKEKNRIVGVHRTTEAEFVRFYDFMNDLIQFNVLVIREADDKLNADIHSATLRPYRQNEINRALKIAGFDSVLNFSTMIGDPFSQSESTDLVIIAEIH
jgi:glycine/sarcosine N-methyltransferase